MDNRVTNAFKKAETIFIPSDSYVPYVLHNGQSVTLTGEVRTHKENERQLRQLLAARDEEIEFLSGQLNSMPGWIRLLWRIQCAIIERIHI